MNTQTVTDPVEFVRSKTAATESSIRLIGRITDEIKHLEERRLALTTHLENAAYAWERQGGASLGRPGVSSRCCTDSFFVYHGVLSLDDVTALLIDSHLVPEPHARFMTDCRFHLSSEVAGLGIDVPFSFIEEHISPWRGTQ